METNIHLVGPKADSGVEKPDQKTYHKERLRSDRCVCVDAQRVMLLLVLVSTLKASTRQSSRLMSVF